MSGHEILQPPRPKKIDPRRAEMRREFEALRPPPAEAFGDLEDWAPTTRIVAITSLSPSPASAARQRQCVKSWIAAGCEVFALQASDDEIERLGKYPGASFAVVEPSSEHAGKFIPISRMVRWAAEHHPDATILLVNADCELAIGRRVIGALAQRYADGCTYLVRHEVYPDGREELHGCGVDGFLFAARLGRAIPDSKVLCMGKPGWDWWVPTSFREARVPLYSPRFRVLLHHIHALRWSAAEHARTCKEALRLTHVTSLDEMSRTFRAATTPIVKLEPLPTDALDQP